jgi:hypothetical protein
MMSLDKVFVNTFKRDYVHINPLETVEKLLAQFPKFFEDYNGILPQQSLKIRSPRWHRNS